MLESVNRRFMHARRRQREIDFIMEAALDVEDAVPGTDAAIDNVVDPDSVPDEVYRKIDKALDDIVNREDYDDTEIKELIKDDMDDEDFDDEDIIDDMELDGVITEAAGAWLDCEDMGHPDMDRNDGSCDDTEQPEYDAEGSVIDGGGESMTEAYLGNASSIAAFRKYARGETPYEYMTVSESAKIEKYQLYQRDAHMISVYLRDAKRESDPKKAKELYKKALENARTLRSYAARLDNDDFLDWAWDLFVKPWFWFVADVAVAIVRGDSPMARNQSQAMAHYDALINQINKKMSAL